MLLWFLYAIIMTISFLDYHYYVLHYLDQHVQLDCYSNNLSGTAFFRKLLSSLITFTCILSWLLQATKVNFQHQGRYREQFILVVKKCSNFFNIIRIIFNTMLTFETFHKTYFV